MKKIFCMMLALMTLLALCASLTACGVEGTGEYKLEKFSLSIGGEVDADAESVTLKLEADGDAKLAVSDQTIAATMMLSEETLICKWELEDGLLSLVPEEGKPALYTFKKDGNELTLENALFTLTLSK